MHKITDEEIDFILDDIKGKGILIEDIQYNLLDHICCVIENEMPEKEDFFKFYEYILPRFFKESLREIQEETELLLKFKDYYTMKKSLYISGLISAVLTLAGATFKVLHWPGAAFMIFVGILFFSLLFLPMMMVIKFRDDETTTNKIVFSIGLLLAIGASIGILFKLMHWPYANVLMIWSSALFIFGFAPLYFVTNIRNAEKKLNTTVNTVLMMAAGGMLFALMNLGFSKHLEDSYLSSQAYIEQNHKGIKSLNSEYYAQIPTNNDLEVLKKATLELDEKIEMVKKNLVEEVEGIQIGAGEVYGAIEYKNPKEVQKVHQIFENGKNETGRESLIKAIGVYNEMVKSILPDAEHRIINLDLMPLKNLSLELALQELTQIQLQIANNENSYLSYKLALVQK